MIKMEETSQKFRFFRSGKVITFYGVILSLFAFDFTVSAVNPLTRSQFSEVINQVNVLKANQAKKRPQVGDTFQIPELLQTGPRSRAELIAEDRTVTRVGANTIFSFSSEKRTLHLQRGSLLFHSPQGRGGGTIKTASASAAVLGTTLIVTATKDGGFKCLVLEGVGEVRLANGFRQRIEAGELVFIAPGSQSISQPLPYNLKEQIENSSLVQGFSRPLLSLHKINQAIDMQYKIFPHVSSSPFLMTLAQHQKDTAITDPNTLTHLNEINRPPSQPQVEKPPRVENPAPQNPTRPAPPIPG